MGLTGGSQRDTKTSVKLEKGLGALVERPERRGLWEGFGIWTSAESQGLSFWVGTRVPAVRRNDPYVLGQLFFLSKSRWFHYETHTQEPKIEVHLFRLQNASLLYKNPIKSS